jgi:hypothetical protein
MIIFIFNVLKQKMEAIPGDILTLIGQFIDIKLMEDRLRFIKLTEKFETIKHRTVEEWIDVAVNYPEQFDILSIKVYPKKIKVVKRIFCISRKITYTKLSFAQRCLEDTESHFQDLRIKLYELNLSRVRLIHEGQEFTTLYGDVYYTVPDIYWRWQIFIPGSHPDNLHGCNPLKFIF